MGLGLRRWLNRLDSQRQARASGLSDTAFVKALYEEMLGRPPDPEARDNALRSLGAGTLNRAHLRRVLANSTEHQAYQLILDLYQDLLGRKPTPEDRWAGLQVLQETGMDPTPLRQTITDTMEYYFLTTPPPPDEEPYRAATLPAEVWLELTTRCNMVPPCIMCGRSALPSPDWHDMTTETWQQMLPVLQQAHIVGLHGGGEPLMYPHLFALLDHLDPQRTEVGFNTSGHLLTTTNCRQLIERQVAWISVSLDAASPEMYLRLRRSDRFEQVLDKIRRFNELKDEMGSLRPRISVNMTVMCTNLPQVPHFVELAAEVGADSVMFQQIKPGGNWVLEAPDGYLFDYRKEELSNCPQEHAEAMEQAWERALELGLEMNYEIVYRATGADWPEERTRTPTPAGSTSPEDDSLPPPAASVPTEALCADPWTSLLVYVDGEATFCCYHFPHTILGNVREQPFEEIWNGPRARSVRKIVLEEAAPKCCQGCFRAGSC